eukprot:m.239201 g.239201  ORF g.239201 m.239201 type:complete len:352 (-) comp26574_c1_seq3:197-1252(-)
MQRLKCVFLCTLRLERKGMIPSLPSEMWDLILSFWFPLMASRAFLITDKTLNEDGCVPCGNRFITTSCFDHCFPVSPPPQDLYSRAGAHVCESFLLGISGVHIILTSCYGLALPWLNPTTQGPESIIGRTLEHIFDRLPAASETHASSWTLALNLHAHRYGLTNLLRTEETPTGGVVKCHTLQEAQTILEGGFANIQPKAHPTEMLPSYPVSFVLTMNLKQSFESCSGQSYTRQSTLQFVILEPRPQPSMRDSWGKCFQTFGLMIMALTSPVENVDPQEIASDTALTELFQHTLTSRKCNVNFLVLVLDADDKRVNQSACLLRCGHRCSKLTSFPQWPNLCSKVGVSAVRC